MTSYVTPAAQSEAKARTRAKVWYWKNRDYALERERARYAIRRLDPNWRKERNEQVKRTIQDFRHRVLEGYGNTCVCCGETTPEFLTLDHINGGGRRHRAERSPYSYWKWFIKNDYPQGFQVLCMNCNFAKGATGTCPHQKERSDND